LRANNAAWQRVQKSLQNSQETAENPRILADNSTKAWDAYGRLLIALLILRANDAAWQRIQNSLQISQETAENPRIFADNSTEVIRPALDSALGIARK
jgi:hypothetical protein